MSPRVSASESRGLGDKSKTDNCDLDSKDWLTIWFAEMDFLSIG